MTYRRNRSHSTIPSRVPNVANRVPAIGDIQNDFGKDGPAKNVTALATAMLPPEKPVKETVAWEGERRDGGRGVGVVMPHLYRPVVSGIRSEGES